MVERTFFHRDWLIPILLLVGTQIIQRIDHFGLGYALYRITSDVEKLPFPMAPVGRPRHHGPGRVDRGKAEELEMAGLFHRRHHRSGFRQRSMCCCRPSPVSCSPNRSG